MHFVPALVLTLQCIPHSNYFGHYCYDFEPVLELTQTGMANIKNEDREMEKSVIQLVLDHARITVPGLLTKTKKTTALILSL